MDLAKKFYSGFVSLIGRPNVGKSTLMNRLIGEKIAIISNKPQTTRNRVQSILTKDDFQIVFIDTPGIHKPKHKLGEYMVKSAETTLNEVDAVLFLIEPADRILEADRLIIEKLARVKSPVILVINKIDMVDRERIYKVIDDYRKLYNFAEVVPISAFEGTNTDELLETLKKYLPEGPMYFPADMVTDQPDLTDDLYENAALHSETGAWQMIFGVVTRPEYRKHGLAAQLLNRAIADARQQGRKGLVLTCKDKLVHYYAKFGFVNEGVSQSTHGNVAWNQMRLTF